MSAIIAGKACKTCESDYYISLGHPDWFKKCVAGKESELTDEERKLKELFEALQQSGRCPRCQLLFSLETAAFISSITGIDLDFGGGNED